jgi:hypothetical protein
MSAPHGAELSEMRVMALHALALEREISEEDLDAAMDSGEPKAALIRLLVAAQPTASAALVARPRTRSCTGARRSTTLQAPMAPAPLSSPTSLSSLSSRRRLLHRCPKCSASPLRK